MEEQQEKEMAEIMEEDQTESITEESAPSQTETQTDSENKPEPEAETEGKPEVEADKKRKGNGFQDRINKKTRDYYAEKNRADALQKQLEELQGTKDDSSNSRQKPPAIDDPEIDYDENKLLKATVAYEVEQQQAKIINEQAEKKAIDQRVKNAEIMAERVEKAQIPDYDETVQHLTENVDLPFELVEAIQLDEKGPEIVDHLGKNLDIASELAEKSIYEAIKEVGKLSVQLNSSPSKKLTNAPKPVQTISSGGIPKKSLEDMSMEEIMALD